MLPFMTTFDPLGGSTGSIDPLGALQTYGLLADLFLPGVTTITTRSRYLSMLCAAIANAEKHRQILPGASGLAQRRKAAEPFERLWALACVAAREAGHAGAADGLRGITYADKSYHCFVKSDKKINCDFPLLKFQSRTGAVGTYWTAMVGGQLVRPETGALSMEGDELAEQFPEIPLEKTDLKKLADPLTAHRVTLSFDTLMEWSEKAHLQAAGPEEHRLLGEALTADDRRESVCRALVSMKDNFPDSWDTTELIKLGKTLAKHPRAVVIGMPSVIEAIVIMEQFHEAVLVVFETLLWWGTMQDCKPISELLVDYDFRKATDRCRETAQQLREFFQKCDRLEIRGAIDEMVGFCNHIDRCQSSRDVVSNVLDRHHRVQSGKIDGGLPKRDWITWDQTTVLRPSPRFQRSERPTLANGLTLTHPYRLEPFIYMLQENSLLSCNKS